MAAHTVHLGVHARPAYTYTNHVAVGANRTRPARLASLASKVGSRQKCCVSASAHTAAAPEMTLMLPSPGNIGVAQKTGELLPHIVLLKYVGGPYPKVTEQCDKIMSLHTAQSHASQRPVRVSAAWCSRISATSSYPLFPTDFRQLTCESPIKRSPASEAGFTLLPLPSGVILAQCPDTQGITVALAQLLFHFQCNILQSDQFTDNSFTPTRLFQRIHFDYAAMATNNASIIALETALAQLAGQYEMEYKVRPQ